MDWAFIHQLETRLQQPLPGAAVQYKMAHAARRTPMPAVPDTARQAGVLALFYPKELGWHIVLIERDASNPRDRHGGQISFPGGKFEESDTTLTHTALREAQEEIGVVSSEVQILGALTPLYIPVSNFQVNPVVGFVDYKPQFIPQQQEVHSILEVPFSLFQSPSTVQSTDLRIAQNITLKEVPYYHVFGKIVWGATAMMLSELIEICS